jgi:hypothetical protein
LAKIAQASKSGICGIVPPMACGPGLQGAFAFA